MGIVDTDDHVEVVERTIGTIKENIRSLMHGIPCQRIPRLMVKRLVEVATRNTNSFPVEGGISDEHSPLSIVTGAPLPDARTYSVDFGTYAEVFEDNGWFQNSNKSRSAPAVALGLPPCRRPGQIFMSLVPGRRSRRKKSTELLLPEWVVERVHYMVQRHD